MNPTIEGLADLFLPMSTFAEHDGFVIPYYMSNNVWLGCMAKGIQHRGYQVGPGNLL